MPIQREGKERYRFTVLKDRKAFSGFLDAASLGLVCSLLLLWPRSFSKEIREKQYWMVL